MNGKVGQIKMIIVDQEGNSTMQLNIGTFLALVDAVPILIRFKDLLERFKVFF